MSLRKNFALSIRKQLDRYPVWDLGAPITLGDYGELRDGTFFKQGNIHEFVASFSQTYGNETPYVFTTNGTNLIDSHAGGSIELPGASTPLRASAEVHFGSEHGLFIRAQRSRVIQISALHQLALQLRQSGRWKFRWKIVTEVREVNPATIIMGSSAGTTLKIEAQADLLEQFKVGGLTAGAAVSFTGEAALQIIGVKGPIFLDLCYLPRFWSGDASKAAAPTQELTAEPYIRLDTSERIADDVGDQ